MDAGADVASRLWAALTAVAGLVALIVTFSFQALPEVSAAGACARDDAAIRFELARSPADLDAIFGPAGDPCRPKAFAAVEAQNRLDVRAYIPAYTAFIAFGALFLARGRLRPAALAALATALGALCADYVETFTLLAVTPDLHPAPQMLARAATAAWIKFALLAANSLLLVTLCLTARRRILAVLLLLPAIGVAFLFADLRWVKLQILCVLAGWTSLLAVAIRHAASGRG